ncbi:MAG: hypothetical protein AAGD09_01655 [Cyanobacteria bacterium P01_F01_bin.56]
MRRRGAAGGEVAQDVKTPRKTLDKVKAVAELADITLFLVDWGYNTAAERDRATQDPRIHLLSLPQMTGEFAAWLPAS